MAASELMVGRVLGHHRILGQIGAGGMGVVFRAHDVRLDRDVAIKVLSPGSVGDVKSRARLLREARTASLLNHPNICTVHEVGEADGHAYIVMELVEGRPLRDMIPPQGMSHEEVVHYGLQVTDGVAHAHARGVVHRDLKSSNVVVTPEARAKVLDFGLARQVTVDERAETVTQAWSAMTRPGTVAGTLASMAPEQLRAEPSDARVDVWAIGVMLYECAAGVLPFRGQSGFELASAILHRPPAPLPSRVPADLGAVIARCLEKEPARRYPHAGEVRGALEAIRSGRVRAWETIRYRLGRRRRVAVALGVLLFLAAAAAAGRTWLQERVWGGGPRIESVVVLPLENLTGDPEQDYLAAGIHEALITDLAKLRGFRRVIARPSAMRYRNTTKSMQQIGMELAVDAIVTGSVVRRVTGCRSPSSS